MGIGSYRYGFKLETGPMGLPKSQTKLIRLQTFKY
jgi:hypothetical protein